jgi:phosphatidylglycerophosphatase C
VNLALFDFDGTITTGDTFTRFIHFAVPPARKIVGGLLLSPVLVGYRLRSVPAPRARPMVAHVSFRGRRADAVRALGHRYATDVLPHLVRPGALERIRWHQQQGDRVVVVSASLDVYVGPWCATLGLERICTELEERNGTFTGRYCDGDCSGTTKARRIVERYDLARYPIVYAYGDTMEDREMLELAHRKYFRWQEIGDWSDARVQGQPQLTRR